MTVRLLRLLVLGIATLSLSGCYWWHRPYGPGPGYYRAPPPGPGPGFRGPPPGPPPGPGPGFYHP